MAGELSGEVSLYKVSPADEAYQLFSGAIDTQQSARDQSLREAMQGIYALSEGFARAMVEADMPVSHVPETVYSAEPSWENRWEPPIVARRSHPLWLVVRNQDLSGCEMRHASICEKVAHYSLLSHSYSGSHNEYKNVDPDKVSSLSLAYNETLRYQERAIAVSATGKLVTVWRSFLDGTDYRIKDSARDRSYSVVAQPTQPSDLFDIEKRIAPKHLVGVMRARLTQSMEEYRGKLNEERKQGTVFRDQAYYTVQELPVPSDESSEKSGGSTSKRRWRRG